MKFGLTLPWDAGADRLMALAKEADSQGFDSVWLPDHLMMPAQFGPPRVDAPLDNFTMMAAIGGAATSIRLAWSMLNPSFRKPAVLAKMLATLDLITHGRVICAIGSGNNKAEYDSYDLPGYLEDHAERTTYGREVVQLLKQLWSNPAPALTTFEGRHVRVKDLPFNPAPYQQPHPPIWVGGDSESSLETVKQLADGWVMLSSGPAEVAKARAASDWPQRPMTIVKTYRIFVDVDQDTAIEVARQEYDRMAASGAPGTPASFDAFLDREIAGDADDCLARLAEIESAGINYIRLAFRDPALQDRVARLLIPRLDEVAAAVTH